MGLGNPGKQYEQTRHNIGFMVLDSLARRLAVRWREERSWPGRVAKASEGGTVWHLLQPTTYMNLSGQAVRAYLDYHRLPVQNMLVVVDDIAVPFGQMRLRKDGSAGGHNGLKSVQAHLGTASYSRLRLGIGDRTQGDLADYVLSKFSSAEQTVLPEVLEKSVEAILSLPHTPLDVLMTRLNARPAEEREASKGKKELDLQENKHDSTE